MSIKENVRIFSKLGYEYIRYDPRTYLFQKKRTGTPLEIFKRDLKTIKAAGMGIEEFHHYKIDFRNLKKNLKVYLAAMKLAKVKNFVFHANKNNLTNAKELNKIIKILKNNNINFCIENECLCITTPDKMAKALEKMPDAKICLDIGHSFMTGIDPYEFYKRFKNKIIVFKNK